jgi:hypothetical protein
VDKEIIDSIESNNNIELKVEEKEETPLKTNNDEIQIEEKDEYNEEIKEESNNTETIESNTVDVVPEADPEPAEVDTKKKRTYKPRKKKI